MRKTAGLETHILAILLRHVVFPAFGMFILQFDIEEIHILRLVQLKGAVNAFDHAELAHILVTGVVSNDLKADVGEVDIADFRHAIAPQHGRLLDAAVNVVKLQMAYGLLARRLGEPVVQAHKGQLPHVHMEIAECQVVYVCASGLGVARVFCVDVYGDVAAQHGYVAEGAMTYLAIAHADADRMGVCASQYAIGYGDPFAGTWIGKPGLAGPQRECVIAHVNVAIGDSDMRAAIDVDSVILADIWTVAYADAVNSGTPTS